MKIELFYAEGCGSCSAARQTLKQAVLAAFASDVDWRELEIVEHIEQAVQLGVLHVPAVAVEGSLVFAKLPTAEQLVAALNARLRRS